MSGIAAVQTGAGWNVRSIESPVVSKSQFDLSSIIESYERSRDRNPRVSAVIASAEMVSDTVYANAAALETAFPAASNSGKCGKVGSAGNYTLNLSNGSSYTQTPNLMGYLRTGVSTTGYTTTNFAPASLTNTQPAQDGVQLTKPFRAYGCMLETNNGIQGLSGYSLSGAMMQSSTGRVIVPTDEPEPILRCIGSSLGYVMNVDFGDEMGFRSIVDPAITSNTGSPYYLTRQAFLGAAAGGINAVKLDFSQFGGRKKRLIQFVLYQDTTLTDFRIKEPSSYFAAPASPRIWLLTDSLGGTAFLGNMADAYPSVLQDVTGVPDIINLFETGTGFLNKGAGNAWRTHKEKLQYMLQCPQYANPDLIILPMSINDVGLPGLTGAMVDCINFALATSPGVPILVPGTTCRNALADQTASIASEQIGAAAVASLGSALVRFVPMMTDTPQAIRGDGNIDAPAGNGNADLMYRNGDQVHWGSQGHLIFARDILGPKIATVLRDFVQA